MPEWTPVDPKVENMHGNAGPTFCRWNASSKYCYTTNRDCANCDNYRGYGFSWDGVIRQCWVPCAVQQLLDAGTTPAGQAKPKATAFKVSQATLARVKRLMQQGWTQEGIRALIKQGRETTAIYMQLAAQELGYGSVDEFQQANLAQAQVNKAQYSRRQNKKTAVI